MVFHSRGGVRSGYPVLAVSTLRRYLKLLELAVISERILVGQAPTTEDSFDDSGFFDKILNHPDLSEQGIRDFPFREVLDNLSAVYYPMARDERVVESLWSDLRTRGILVDGATVQAEFLPSPLELTESYVAFDHELGQRLSKERASWREWGVPDHQMQEHMALATLVEEYGRAAYLVRFCSEARIPYTLSETESRSASRLERQEVMLSTTVMVSLRDSLDATVTRHLHELQRFGVDTVLPATPIAATIIKQASSLDDINEVALQLREDYSDLRRNVAEMEAELLEEKHSVKRKAEVLRQIKQILDEIQDEDMGGWQMGFRSVSNLLDLAIGSSTSGGVTFAAAPAHLLKLPMALVTRAIRRRKVRVLLRAKKDFLETGNWTDRLANVFGVPRDEVIRAFGGTGRIDTRRNKAAPHLGRTIP